MIATKMRFLCIKFDTLADKFDYCFFRFRVLSYYQHPSAPLVENLKELTAMTDTENTLIETIRSHDDHTEALLIAAQVIIEFLSAQGSAEPAPSAPLKVS